ncbi:hypothetical protein [Halarcobacter bivalviorum]|nr:hypothetical protein [Halarcobacter bivalviorum]AXH12825.1 hypothetical protein ABIV_1836 [Halarcobacter bivalviorum]RXK04437.1 hypothetical protein CRU97_10640 [Halarcobacter bivalviorum]
MAKEYKIQKKKTVATTVSQVTFRILVTIAIIIFAYLIYDKMDFANGGFDFSSADRNKVETKTPEQLKWFDDFKGVENVPSKKQLEEKNEKSGNFLGFGSK